MLVVLCRTVLAFKGRGINIRPVTPNIFGNTFSHQGLKTCARTPLHSSGWSFLLVRLRLHVCSVKATFELGNLTSPTCVLESLVSTPWTCWLIQVLRFWGDNKHILSSSFQEVSCIPNNYWHMSSRIQFFSTKVTMSQVSHWNGSTGRSWEWLGVSLRFEVQFMDNNELRNIGPNTMHCNW